MLSLDFELIYDITTLRLYRNWKFSAISRSTCTANLSNRSFLIIFPDWQIGRIWFHYCIVTSHNLSKLYCNFSAECVGFKSLLTCSRRNVYLDFHPIDVFLWSKISFSRISAFYRAYQRWTEMKTLVVNLNWCWSVWSVSNFRKPHSALRIYRNRIIIKWILFISIFSLPLLCFFFLLVSRYLLSRFGNSIELTYRFLNSKIFVLSQFKSNLLVVNIYLFIDTDLVPPIVLCTC